MSLRSMITGKGAGALPLLVAFCAVLGWPTVSAAEKALYILDRTEQWSAKMDEYGLSNHPDYHGVFEATGPGYQAQYFGSFQSPQFRGDESGETQEMDVIYEAGHSNGSDGSGGIIGFGYARLRSRANYHDSPPPIQLMGLARIFHMFCIKIN